MNANGEDGDGLSRAARALAGRLSGPDALAAAAVLTSLVLREPAVTVVLVLMLAGGAELERRAAARAASALDALARRTPSVAHRESAGRLVDLPIGEVAVGDLLVVLPHELCPVDGVVVEGHGSMDESYLTGEPYRIAKTPGSAVLSGAINGGAALKVAATRRAVDSRYAAIMRVMKETQLARPRLRRLADRVASWYAPAAFALAAGAWAVSGDPRRFLAVLVIATPCPLLIAIPVAVVGAISLAARRGIVVKDPSLLETIGACRTVIFDKTGTLTYGRPSVAEVVALGGANPAEALRLAAGLERYSRHPLAAAVRDEAAARGLISPAADEARELPGRGLEGRVAGRAVRVGGRALLGGSGPEARDGLECVVVVDGTPAALIRFHDAPRPDGRAFLAHLAPAHGVARTMLVSGDREAEARRLAAAVGVVEVRAGCTPERKVEIVREEAARARTLFVGDGVNDAPALAAADAGVAMGRDCDVAAAAAGAVLLTPSIASLDELIHIGSRMRRIALQSAAGGMALSAVGMALAATGLLSPVRGAVAQELIDLAAVLNALRAAYAPRAPRDY